MLRDKDSEFWGWEEDKDKATSTLCEENGRLWGVWEIFDLGQSSFGGHNISVLNGIRKFNHFF